MNRRNFLRAATGCAVAAVVVPTAIRNAVVMVPKKYTMSEAVWITQELAESMPLTFFNRLEFVDNDPIRSLWLVKIRDHGTPIMRWSVRQEPDKW